MILNDPFCLNIFSAQLAELELAEAVQQVNELLETKIPTFIVITGNGISFSIENEAFTFYPSFPKFGLVFDIAITNVLLSQLSQEEYLFIRTLHNNSTSDSNES